MTSHRIVTIQRFGAALTEYSFIEARFEDRQSNQWSTQIAIPWEMAELFQEALAALPRRPTAGRRRLTEMLPPDLFYAAGSVGQDFGLWDLTLPEITAAIDERQRLETGA